MLLKKAIKQRETIGKQSLRNKLVKTYTKNVPSPPIDLFSGKIKEKYQYDAADFCTENK